MDKNDYLLLKERYFEACLTPKETRALKEYVGQCDDADFDDVRAVLSYMCTGREVHRKRPASQRGFRPLGIMALAASLAMAFFVWLSEKRKLAWVESFSIAGSMLLAMASAVLLGGIR